MEYLHKMGMKDKKFFSSRSFDSRQKGQDLVEFALVLPILLLVVFGVLDLGRAFHAAIQMANSARVAARHATLHVQATDSEIKDVGVQEANSSGINLVSNDFTLECKIWDAVSETYSDWVSPCPRTPVPLNRLPTRARFRVLINFEFDLTLGEIVGIPSTPITRSIDMVIP